ncbi:hypothetical protein PIB30_005843 [Stylosanthes scabra]|uniref:Secreted protein n=1 Tax=Stylosanthes scabra TaxID=79078 RepID=A0ABU6Z202_9FABA|nr:hypothetical protein [Stylosanthes scabra]
MQLLCFVPLLLSSSTTATFKSRRCRHCHGFVVAVVHGVAVEASVVVAIPKRKRCVERERFGLEEKGEDAVEVLSAAIALTPNVL